MFLGLLHEHPQYLTHEMLDIAIIDDFPDLIRFLLQSGIQPALDWITIRNVYWHNKIEIFQLLSDHLPVHFFIKPALNPEFVTVYLQSNLDPIIPLRTLMLRITDSADRYIYQDKKESLINFRKLQPVLKVLLRDRRIWKYLKTQYLPFRSQLMEKLSKILPYPIEAPKNSLQEICLYQCLKNNLPNWDLLSLILEIDMTPYEEWKTIARRQLII